MALRGGRGRVVHARDQGVGLRRAGLIVHRGQRKPCEGDSVDGHPERAHRREDRIPPGLGAERLHGGRQDLGGQKRIVRRLLVRELEHERDVRGRSRSEPLGQHPEVDAARLAKRDRIPPREATARVHEHSIPGRHPLHGAIDVPVRILSPTDDDDVKPEARQTTP